VDDDLFPPLPPSQPPSREPPPERPRALTVGELARALKQTVESGFPLPVWTEGEVTGARPAPKGHHYFSLRDEKEDASVEMVMYRTALTPRAQKLLVDGARVRLRGKPTLWAPRGRLQFVVDRVEPVGRGALLEAHRLLKEKLSAEGLFDPAKKRKLPADPRIVGVVTSSTGAVIHDIGRVAFRRGGARILLSSAQVQGAGAASSIVRALAQLQRVAEVDVIIIGRGGGSLEDLLPFSDEAVVRAVARSRVPIVSAVGHEVDVSLTDFAADARAATPSQAAEMVVPDRASRRVHLDQLKTRLERAMRSRLRDSRGKLDRARHRLGDPRLVLASFQQALDDRRARAEAVLRRRLAREAEELAKAAKADAGRSADLLSEAAASRGSAASLERIAAFKARHAEAQASRAKAGFPSPSPRVVKPGTMRVEMRVEDQTANIGMRNVHTLHAGGSKSVGGGRSDFLVFLVPAANRAAELHFDGEKLAFLPRRPELFPGTEGPIEDCLDQDILMLGKGGYPLVLRFQRYEPPADRINRLLHCIETPGLFAGLDRED